MMETTAGATSSGSVATVAQPMMATERRINPSVYANQGSKPAKMDDHCPECKCNPCECHEESRKAPDAPKAKEFGLWQNSVLAGKEQKSKKTKKKTNESTLNERDFGSGQRQLELEEAHKDDEDSVGELGLPSVQRGLKKMAARHAGENYTPAQLAALRKRLDAAGAAADEKEAARKARIDKPYSEYAPDFKKDVTENQKSKKQIDEISSKLAGNYYQSVSRKHIDKLGGIRPNMYDRIEKDMGPNRKKGIDRATNRIMRDAEKVKPDVTKTSVKGKKRKDDIEEGLRNKSQGNNKR